MPSPAREGLPTVRIARTRSVSWLRESFSMARRKKSFGLVGCLGCFGLFFLAASINRCLPPVPHPEAARPKSAAPQAPPVVHKKQTAKQPRPVTAPSPAPSAPDPIPPQHQPQVVPGWDASQPVPQQQPYYQPAPAPDYQRTVYITATGARYHSGGCRDLQGGGSPMAVGEAQRQGYTPCGHCGG